MLLAGCESYSPVLMYRQNESSQRVYLYRMTAGNRLVVYDTLEQHTTKRTDALSGTNVQTGKFISIVSDERDSLLVGIGHPDSLYLIPFPEWYSSGDSMLQVISEKLLAQKVHYRIKKGN